MSIEILLGDKPALTAQSYEFRIKFLPVLADVLEIVVSDPAGKEVQCDGDEQEPGLWKCTTSPLEVAGEYKIEIKANDKVVSQTVACRDWMPEYAARCRAEGAGLLDNKVAAFAKAPFRFLFPEDMEEEHIMIEAKGPDGSGVVMDGEAMPGEKGCWICYFCPLVGGPHQVTIAVGEHPIPGFPKTVLINNAEATFLDDISVENMPSELQSWDKECHFDIAYPPAIPSEMIRATVTYPSGTTVKCQVAEGGRHRSFACGMPGVYEINVSMKDSPVRGSPFHIKVHDSALQAAAQATVSGDGILSDVNTCGHATDFLLTFTCPENELAISCIGPDGKPTMIDGMEVEGRDDCWRVEYLPTKEGNYEITVTVAGYPIPNSPFNVYVRQSIGGRGKLLVFFSSASGKREAQRDLNRLEAIFLAKGLLEKEDFAPFHAVDMWEREAREELFRIAGSRDLPQIWVNDYFVGGVQQLQELEDEHSLDMLFEKMYEDAKKPKTDLEEAFLTSKLAGDTLNHVVKGAVDGKDCCIQ